VKFVRMLSVVALGLFVASIARADGLDGHVLLGGGPGGSPSCNSFQASTNAQGLINALSGNADCVVTGQTATIIQFAILDINSKGGLGCASSLTEIGWTLHLSNHLGGIDVCTLTAPTDGEEESLSHFAGPLGHESDPPECDFENFAHGIPVGCDITFTTDNPNQPFVGNALFDVSADNTPLASLPEPGSLSLLLSGLTGLVFLRRKFAQ
jgi:hypothetical protein